MFLSRLLTLVPDGPEQKIAARACMTSIKARATASVVAPSGTIGRAYAAAES